MSNYQSKNIQSMQLRKQLDINKVLFLDIETVPALPNYKKLDDRWKKLWEKKSQSLVKENITAADMYDRSAIYAEFGKVVCICVGILTGYPNNPSLRLKSFAGDDERKILSDFADLLRAPTNWCSKVMPPCTPAALTYSRTTRSRLAMYSASSWIAPFALGRSSRLPDALTTLRILTTSKTLTVPHLLAATFNSLSAPLKTIRLDHRPGVAGASSTMPSSKLAPMR